MEGLEVWGCKKKVRENTPVPLRTALLPAPYWLFGGPRARRAGLGSDQSARALGTFGGSLSLGVLKPPCMALRGSPPSTKPGSKSPRRKRVGKKATWVEKQGGERPTLESLEADSCSTKRHDCNHRGKEVRKCCRGSRPSGQTAGQWVKLGWRGWRFKFSQVNRASAGGEGW